MIVLLANGKKKVTCIQPLNLNLELALTLVYFQVAAFDIHSAQINAFDASS